MIAEIITIGDELLIGQVVDTNSAWIGQQLNLAGISVKQISSVSDDRAHILKALDEACSRADIILITGGLGPTKDDITKKTLCEYFKTTLVFSEAVYADVERIFATFGKEVTAINRLQAEVPANCEPLQNNSGTAPGMWFDTGGKIFVSMPGVPYEMKGIMSDHVIPRLKKKFKLPHILHRTVLTQGLGESFLAQIIEKWEDSLAEHGIKLAYLPSPGMVRLRMSVKGADEKKLQHTVDEKTEELKKLIPEYIYGFEEFGKEKETLAHIVGELLKKNKSTLATAESCTGGYISHLITAIPGSSAYYMGSVIAYANDIKINELRVDAGSIDKHGAVSQEVVEQMAQNILTKFNVTFSIAVSGIAGPDRGASEKPVGTTWIAVASAKGTVSEKFIFGSDRERNIQKAGYAALNMLRKMLESQR